MSRFGPMRDRFGTVVQGGVGPRTAGPNPRSMFGVYVAVVMRTFAVDDPERVSSGRASTTRLQAVECDVILLRGTIPLPRVPVQQPNHGLSDAGPLWIPKPCTRVIRPDGSTDTSRDMLFQRVTSRGSPIDVPQSLNDLDGDYVMVQFIGGDPMHPLITGAYSHPRTRRAVIGTGTGWRADRSGAPRGTIYQGEAYSRHAGTELRVNEIGDFLADMTGATADEEQEQPNENSGQYRVRLKLPTGEFIGPPPKIPFVVEIDGTDVLEVYLGAGGQVRIDLGDGAAERLVLGDSFKTFLNTFFADFFDLHTHSVPALGTSGPPSPAFVSPTRPDMDATLLSDLAKTKKS